MLTGFNGLRMFKKLTLSHGSWHGTKQGSERIRRRALRHVVGVAHCVHGESPRLRAPRKPAEGIVGGALVDGQDVRAWKRASSAARQCERVGKRLEWMGDVLRCRRLGSGPGRNEHAILS